MTKITCPSCISKLSWENLIVKYEYDGILDTENPIVCENCYYSVPSLAFVGEYNRVVAMPLIRKDRLLWRHFVIFLKRGSGVSSEFLDCEELLQASEVYSILS